MVTAARESRGITQAELASRLGVTQGKVSKLEHGLLPISQSELNRLSQVLDYPPHFFSQNEPIYGVGTTELFHRKRQNVGSRLLGKIYAQINIRRIQLKNLLKSVDIDINIPRLDIDEYNGSAEDIAALVRAKWLLPRGPVQNLTKAIEDAGGIIMPFDFGTRQIDAISRSIPGLPPLFFVSPRAPGDRLRFTLCHELGHTIMHDIPHPSMEEEADRFAAEFLMSAKDIRSTLHDLSLPKLASLKRHWKVSMAALLQRASHLGTVTPRQARRFWMRMAKEGYRTREPVELDVPLEQPGLLQEIIDVHRDELNYTIRELSHLLALNEHEFRSLYLGQKAAIRLLN